MVKNWAPAQEDIKNLYYVQNKPLHEVMRVIKGKHGIHASERAYRTQLQKWGYMKYSTESHPKPNGSTRKSPTSRQSHAAGTLSTARNTSVGGGNMSFSPSVSSMPLYGQSSNGMYLAPPSSAVTMVNPNDQYLDFNSNPSHPALNTTSSYNIITADTESDGKTRLHRASINKSFEEIQTLLFDGAIVNVKDHFGNDPLHYAVIADQLEPIKLLLQFGADVNSRGQLGRSPLHLAVSNKPVVDALLREGADALCQDDKGDTPLHLALSVATWFKTWGDTVIEALLRAGSDVNLANNAGLTPFHKLLEQDYESNRCTSYILNFLDSGASLACNLPTGRSPWHTFLANGGGKILYGSVSCKDILKRFLSQGADPLAQTPSGDKLLTRFFKYQCISMHQDLAEQFCITTEMGPLFENENSLLHELCRIRTSRLKPAEAKSCNACISILLKRGADPNLRNNKGQTPFLLLFLGAGRQFDFILETILGMIAQGADSTLADHEGNIPLYAAAKRLKSEELIPMLSADAKMTNSEVSISDCAPDSWGFSWKQALKATCWSEAKDFLDQGERHLPQDIGFRIKRSAFAVLAERHVEETMAVTQLEDDAVMIEKRRCQVAAILKDCQKAGALIEPKLFDILLQLC